VTGEGHDLVVVGASAGGLDPLLRIVRELPADYAGTVLIVLHVSPTSPSALPDILDRAGPLPVAHAVDGEPLLSGQVLVAPPDRHMVVVDGHVALTRSARENNHRPAINPLFTSAAAAYGGRVVGIVLSGMLDDGAVGLAAVASAGGVAMVQQPDEALYGSMPRHAVAGTHDARILPAGAMAAELVRLSRASSVATATVPAWVEDESRYSRSLDAAADPAPPPGAVTSQTCPTCGGTLFERDDGGPLRFRCRVGHAWSADGLFSSSAARLEEALWTALRTLEERSALAGRLGEYAASRGNALSAAQFRASADDAERRARAIRASLDDMGGAGGAESLDAHTPEVVE
jgi:two-component system chemotaxis response regulator CheB